MGATSDIPLDSRLQTGNRRWIIDSFFEFNGKRITIIFNKEKIIIDLDADGNAEEGPN